MRTILSRPSRSYRDVEHDAQGLSAVGTAPFALRQGDIDSDRYSVKTHRPSLAEMHFKKQAMHDPNPSSAFSPLPPAFNLGRKNKEQAKAGHRAEVNHMLEPEYQSSRQREDDAASMAGPSRLSSVRTAGGLAALSRKKGRGEDPKPSESVTSFNQQPSGPRRANPGVYVDSSGRTHDTEYDPFAGVAALSRRKSKQRRSAFGPRRNSVSSGSSDGSSDGGHGPVRRAVSGPQDVETERECRRRLEAERRQLDDVSGYAAARRQSLMSDRASGFYSGRGTPSVRSGREDALSLAHTLAPNGRAQSRLSQTYLASPASPTFDRSSAVSGSSHNETFYPAGSSAGDERPTKHTEKTTEPEPEPGPSEATKVAVEQKEKTRKATGPKVPEKDHARKVSHVSGAAPVGENGEGDKAEDEEEGEDPPPGYEEPAHSRKALPELNPIARVRSPTTEPNHSISVLPRPGAPKSKATKPKEERSENGATRITGFNAGPTRPMPPQSVPASRIQAESVLSVISSRSSERGDDTPRHRRPKERPREQLFPETPAQAKRREERERRNLRAGKTPSGTYTADSVLPESSRTRILPEIKFVDDDDPRIVFPPNGASTRIQQARSINTIQSDLRHSFDAGSAHHSGSRIGVGSSREPSAIIEETGGGYLPSRWASGDRQLRVEATTKEMYRPKEWGGRKGDLGGRPDEWRPTVKDEFKREIKDLTTNARFSLFRAKKKIGRRTDL